jgi:putative colanic acid biosynthesis UDP-glucose lipid carrier transferase
MNNNSFELKERYKHEYFEPVILTVRNFGVASPLKKRYNQVLKRVLDILISSLVIVGILSWLLPIIAFLIKINSAGPVFFVQKRNKKNGKLFYCLKLRTMVVNKEADTLTAIVNDERVTSLGKFLRKTHLDEMPQFINVFLGDMSLIGPRPHMFVENIKYGHMFSAYDQRQAVKPGITGLAQSLGYHGPITTNGELEKKIEYDLLYIHNWSLLLDAKILVKTINVIYKKIS